MISSSLTWLDVKVSTIFEPEFSVIVFDAADIVITGALSFSKIVKDAVGLELVYSLSPEIDAVEKEIVSSPS